MHADVHTSKELKEINMNKMLSLMMVGLFCFSMLSIFAAQASTGTWSSKASLPQPLAGFGAAVANGRIYAMREDVNYEYNPNTDSWTSKTPMPTIRKALAVASVNDKIYAIGGTISVSGNTFSANEEFDPSSNNWTVKTPMPTPRNWISAAVVEENIYVISGSNNMGGLYTVNEVYNPQSDSWTVKAPIPTPRHNYGIGVVNNKIYVIGGWGGVSSVATNEEYNPQTDTWTTKTPMPTTRNGLTVAVVNNKIYAIGGATNANPWTNNLDVVEEYNPSTDTWRTVESMLTQRSCLSASTIGNKICALGGVGSAGTLDLNEEFTVLLDTNLSNLGIMPNIGYTATTVSGSGFSPNSDITITWDHAEIPTVPNPLITNSYGNFTAIISVPTQDDAGSHVVKATDEFGNEANATFHVLEMAISQEETRDLSLLVDASTIGVSIIAICLATIALLKKKDHT